jgi:hypothetical protein
MQLATFDEKKQVLVHSLKPGDVFFGGADGNELYCMTKGIPDPDPATALAMRLADGQINGIGKGVNVWTCKVLVIPADF